MSENETKKSNISSHPAPEFVSVDPGTGEEYKVSNIPIQPQRPIIKNQYAGYIKELSSNQLPMVVHLKGDEDFFEQFDLNADEVMEKLSIKRSRLNQISGKELRVGRAKIDRYIRPIYRSEDVENYLAWTRATASHVKSKEAIEIVTNELKEQATTLASSLSKDSGILSNVLNNHLVKLNAFLQSELSNLNFKNQVSNRSLEKIFYTRFESLIKSFKILETQNSIEMKASSDTRELAKDIYSGVKLLASNLNELNSSVQKNSVKLDGIENSTASFLELKTKLATVELNIHSLEGIILKTLEKVNDLQKNNQIIFEKLVSNSDRSSKFKPNRIKGKFKFY